MAKIILKGSHGTTVSRADNIRKEGFKRIIGRRGTGIYFWRDGHYCRQLSISWWKQKLDERDYSGDSDTRCVVIIGIFKLEDNEYLNIDNYEFQEKIAYLADKKKVGGDKRKLAALYDFCISRLEQRQGIKFKIVEMRVSPPLKKYCEYYQFYAVGNPYCYLVRVVDCIVKLEMEID